MQGLTLEEDSYHIFYQEYDQKIYLTKKRLCPTQAGIVPENLFSPRSNKINLLVFFKIVGNVPESKLLRMRKDFSSIKEPMDWGKFPIKLLLYKFTSTKYGQMAQQSGIT